MIDHLTYTQRIALMGPTLTWRSAYANARFVDRTFTALTRHGYITTKDTNSSDWTRTHKGLQWVKESCERQERRLKDDYSGVPFIYTPLDFVMACHREHYRNKQDLSIYVYGSQQPLLVNDGDGQNPLAVMSPWLMWQIEVQRHLQSTVSKSSGLVTDRLLRRHSITGHKSSYGYTIDMDKTLKVYNGFKFLPVGTPVGVETPTCPAYVR